MKKVKLGIIGLGQRGYTLLDTICACEECEIVALCDRYTDRMEQAAEKLKEKKHFPVCYENYKDLLADSNVQAVYVVSSWDEHVKMAIESMRANKITAMEVGGAYEIEECWELVRAYEETKVPFMFMENCCFDEFELLTTSLCRADKLGEIVHCHGAYRHDLRAEVCGGHVNRHYRLENYQKRNCDNYPTHNLGPIAKILDINRGNKLLSLVSVASKSAGMQAFANSEKNPDKTLAGTTFMQGDIISTVIKCVGGQTITLTLNTCLPCYYSREFEVYGTKGLCRQEESMVMLEGDTPLEEYAEPYRTVEKYLHNSEKYKQYMPSVWREATEEKRALGHGGMDYFMFKTFFGAILGGKEMPIDVYDAATWMSITALSEQSIAQGGAPQAIPDYTRGKWVMRERKDVLDGLGIPAEQE